MDFENKVVYQIYPKSFNDTSGNGFGDIRGIIEKLDYIKALGVDYLWLSPINESPQKDNGYDIANYYEIDAMFGTKKDYEDLIMEAKKRGMKVMLDLVLNHTSDQHEWFKKALNGDPEYLDYYVWTDEPNDLIGFFSKSAWSYSEAVGKYYLHLFDESQPDLNWKNPKVRAEIIKMVNYWIELGVEGFRLDVIDLIGKEPEKYITGKGPKFYDYLKELSNNTFKKDLLTVGECWCASHEDSYKMCSDDGLTQVFHFSHLITTNGEDKWEQSPVDYHKIIDIIESWQNGYSKSQTNVMNNHDMPRLISLWLNDDEYRYESATNLATLFTLLKGTQYIYQGEEVGFTNAYINDIKDYNDVETHNKYQVYKQEGKLTEKQIMERIKLISRDNARVPMAWTANGDFTTGTPWQALNNNYKTINVEADLASEKSVYKYYQKLITYKKENYESIINHKLDEINFINNVISYKKSSIEVYANMSDKVISLEHEGQIIFNNYPEFKQQLEPYQAIVFTRTDV